MTTLSLAGVTGIGIQVDIEVNVRQVIIRLGMTQCILYVLVKIGDL